MMDQFFLPVLLTLLGSGVWSFLIEFIKLRSEKASAEKKMLLGLGHDVLYQRLTFYLERGYIEPAELQNAEYVFKPYLALGGNGTIKVLYEKVLELPNKKPQNGDK